MASRNKLSISHPSSSFSKPTAASSYYEPQGTHGHCSKESISVLSECGDWRSNRPEAGLGDGPASTYVFASGFVSGSGRLSALEVGYRSVGPCVVTDQRSGRQCVASRLDYDVVREDSESLMEYVVR